MFREPAKKLTAFVAASTLCACTTLQPVETPAGPPVPTNYSSLVEAGDRVRVTTADGETHRFRVTAVSADRIEGDDLLIYTNEITTFEKREFSRAKTIAISVAGFIALVNVIAYGEAAAEVYNFGGGF